MGVTASQQHTDITLHTLHQHIPGITWYLVSGHRSYQVQDTGEQTRGSKGDDRNIQSQRGAEDVNLNKFGSVTRHIKHKGNIESDLQDIVSAAPREGTLFCR